MRVLAGALLLVLASGVGAQDRTALDRLDHAVSGTDAHAVHEAYEALLAGHPSDAERARAMRLLAGWLAEHDEVHDAIRLADAARRSGDPEAEALLARLDHDGAVTRSVLSSELEPQPADPCDAAHLCDRIRRRRVGAITWELVFRREPSLPSEGEALLEATTAAGRFRVASVGAGGGVGLAGTAYDVELVRMRSDRGVLRLEVRQHDEDYDWCEAYRETDDVTYVCGLDAERPVCFARVLTRRHTWVGLGRIALDGTIDADDEESCGLERRLYAASELAPSRPPWPPDRVEIGDGTLRVIGASAWLRTPRTFAEIAAFTHEEPP